MCVCISVCISVYALILYTVYRMSVSVRSTTML